MTLVRGGLARRQLRQPGVPLQDADRDGMVLVSCNTGEWKAALLVEVGYLYGGTAARLVGVNAFMRADQLEVHLRP